MSERIVAQINISKQLYPLVVAIANSTHNIETLGATKQRTAANGIRAVLTVVQKYNISDIRVLDSILKKHFEKQL